MASPALELQGAIINALKADAALVALVGQRIYDLVPPNVVYPFVSFGGDQSLQNDFDLLPGTDVFIELDAWSRAVGLPEVKRISEAVRDALHDKNLALPVNALALLEHRETRVFRDPDGLTNHAAISLEASVERR